MKKILFLFSLMVLITSCQRSSSQTWEDVKTAGRYLHKGINTLWGKDYDSRLIASEDEFVGPSDEDFIPLQDTDLRTQFTATDMAIPQPKTSSKNTSPQMTRFNLPSGRLQSLFQTLHFETDDHVLREKTDLVAIAKIANYMKKHPNTYVAVEGHCDERASASYNMALGMRRANHIRVLLVKQGVDHNRVYTVSHGKEKPVALGHTSEDYKLNRRAEFKIYEQTKR